MRKDSIAWPRSSSRRAFLKDSALCLGLVHLSLNLSPGLAEQFAPLKAFFKPKISGHLWVYASAYPAPHDATPALERAFRDLHLAGYDGIELMEVLLRHDDAVARLSELVSANQLPVTGSSFGAALWDSTKHTAILADVTVIIKRLGQLKAETFGISVGNAGRPKTEAELDAQAAILAKIVGLCNDSGLTANLHNHIYEVENGMHDLKGTLARLPDMKLGPDLNWLARAGVDPVEFINVHGRQIVYLHLRDQYEDGQWTEYVGQGVTNFPAIAKALRSSAFKGSAAIELAFPEHYVPQYSLMEDWKRSMSYVRGTFGW